MQQQVNEVTGRLPAPSRSLCAKWVAEAIEQISQRTIVRSFVACRVTRPEDYSDSERQAFGLDDLIHMGHVRALAAVIDDDDELRAQLEAVSDADDDEWLHDERTTHVPEQHEEPADWEPDAAEPEDGGAAKASGAAASSRQSVPPTAGAAAGSASADVPEGMECEDFEVRKSDLAGTHPPWAGIVGLDVCVLPAAFPSAVAPSEGMVGWRACAAVIQTVLGTATADT